VVFLQHALMDSSAGWLLLGPSRSIALLLSDAGFDVWLGNVVGTDTAGQKTKRQTNIVASVAVDGAQYISEK